MICVDCREYVDEVSWCEKCEKVLHDECLLEIDVRPPSDYVFVCEGCFIETTAPKEKKARVYVPEDKAKKSEYNRRFYERHSFPGSDFRLRRAQQARNRYHAAKVTNNDKV